MAFAGEFSDCRGGKGGGGLVVIRGVEGCFLRFVTLGCCWVGDFMERC